MYYIIFLTVYTVTTWYKVWEESSEVVVELQVAATALAIPISLREAVEICNGGSCKGLLKLGKTNQNFWCPMSMLNHPGYGCLFCFSSGETFNAKEVLVCASFADAVGSSPRVLARCARATATVHSACCLELPLLLLGWHWVHWSIYQHAFRSRERHEGILGGACSNANGSDTQLQSGFGKPTRTATTQHYAQVPSWHNGRFGNLRQWIGRRRDHWRRSRNVHIFLSHHHGHHSGNVKSVDCSDQWHLRQSAGAHALINDRGSGTEGSRVWEVLWLLQKETSTVPHVDPASKRRRVPGWLDRQNRKDAISDPISGRADQEAPGKHGATQHGTHGEHGATEHGATQHGRTPGEHGGLAPKDCWQGGTEWGRSRRCWSNWIVLMSAKILQPVGTLMPAKILKSAKVLMQMILFLEGWSWILQPVKILKRGRIQSNDAAGCTHKIQWHRKTVMVATGKNSDLLFSFQGTLIRMNQCLGLVGLRFQRTIGKLLGLQSEASVALDWVPCCLLAAWKGPNCSYCTWRCEEIFSTASAAIISYAKFWGWCMSSPFPHQHRYGLRVLYAAICNMWSNLIGLDSVVSVFASVN